MDYIVIDHTAEELQTRATSFGLGSLSPWKACLTFRSDRSVRVQTAGVPELQTLVDHLASLGKAKLAT